MKKLNSSYIKDLNTAIENTVNIEELFCKKVLITGVTGLIGSFLVDMLLQANESKNAEIEIWGLARNERRARERFLYAESNKLHLIIQDVCEPINTIDKIDFIIHAAGDGYPAAFRTRPVETMTPAMLGTMNTLNLAKEKSISSYVYISSGEVYGNREGVDELKENEKYTACGMTVRSCYPVAKQAAEILCASFAEEYAVPAKVARLSHTYGPFVADSDNRASTQFIKSAIARENIVLRSKGEQLRSYTYVADAAAAILTILICGENGEAYNVANPNSKVTVAGFAETVAEISGVECIFEIPNEEQIKEKSPILNAVLASDKLENLGFNGRYSIKEGIEATLKALEV